MTANGSAGTRPYSGAHFALELDGADGSQAAVGLFKSVEGGGVKTDMIKYQNGFERPTFFRLGKAKYEDIKCQVGMAMSRPFYDWLDKFFKGDPERRNGAIVAADFAYKERARRKFQHAMIREVTFPKLDATDKGACYMNVTICPETVIYEAGSGQVINHSEAPQNQKLWSACNFDFQIEGLDGACGRVTKVESFTIKQSPIEHPQGNLRETVKVAGRYELPNIVFHIPEADAQPLIRHYNKHVIRGEVQGETRLTGAIHCYDSGRDGNALFTIELSGVDVFNLDHAKSDASSDELKSVKVELCVEGLKFTYGG